MRKEWQPIEGAKPNLVLWSETPEEFFLTPVESQFLLATLEEQIQHDPSIKLQIAHARVTSREFTNYGFFSNLEVSDDVPAAPPSQLR